MRNTESDGLQTTIFAQYLGTLTELDPNNEALELVPNIEDVIWVTSPVDCQNFLTSVWPACDALPELVVLDLKNSFGS